MSQLQGVLKMSKGKYVLFAGIILLLILAFAALNLGSVVQAGDKVTVCHTVPPQGEIQLEINSNALDTHLAHGDYLGTCGGGATTTPEPPTATPAGPLPPTATPAG
jgi:hypothetical protein